MIFLHFFIFFLLIQTSFPSKVFEFHRVINPDEYFLQLGTKSFVFQFSNFWPVRLIRYVRYIWRRHISVSGKIARLVDVRKSLNGWEHLGEGSWLYPLVGEKFVKNSRQIDENGIFIQKLLESFSKLSHPIRSPKWTSLKGWYRGFPRIYT